MALLAAPAAFEVLSRPEAGAVVAVLFRREAALSCCLAAGLLIHERWQAKRSVEENNASQFSLEMGLVLGALGCTVLGYYGLQPLMGQARQAINPGGLNFGQLHALSLFLFALKTGCVMVLAWRKSKLPTTTQS